LNADTSAMFKGIPSGAARPPTDASDAYGAAAAGVLAIAPGVWT
jgi:hypothetical protein